MNGIHSLKIIIIIFKNITLAAFKWFLQLFRFRLGRLPYAKCKIDTDSIL